jgi:hypothetical protein
MSDFVQRKLAWLQALATDPRLSAFAVRVAVRLVTKYLNGKSETAWPHVETLAADLAVDRRSVQRALAPLVEAGWLERHLERGRGHANVYRIKGGDNAAFSDLKGGQDAAFSDVKGGDLDRKTRRKRRPEPFDEPLEEGVVRTPPRRRRRAEPTQTDFSGRQGSSSPPLRTIPERWEIGDQEIEAAAASPARWNPERAAKEFEKFKTWHAKRGNRSPNWFDNWLTWCQKGAEIEARDSARRDDGSRYRRRDPLEEVFEGVNEFYQEQRAAHEADRRAAAGED